MPYKRYNSPALHAVYKRKFADIQKFIARNYHESAVRKFLAGFFISFDNENTVVHNRLYRSPFLQGENVHVLARKRYAVIFFDVLNSHCSRPYERVKTLYAFRAKRVGENLERGNDFDEHIAFVDSFAVRFAEQFAALAVPADVIKRRTASLAPPRRLGDFLAEG